MHTLTLDPTAFETLDLNQLDSVTGGDAVDTGGQVGEFIGKYAGAGAGAVGGAAVGGLVTTPTVAGVPVGVTAGASAPDFLVDRVVAAVGSLGPLDVDTRPVRHEAVSFSLPPEVR